MYITALDIGTSQAKALVAEMKRDGRFSIVGAFKTPISGLRRGEVVEVGDVAHTLKHLFGEMRSISRSALKNIFMSVSGTNIRMQESPGIVAVSRADNEIYKDDIERVIRASQAINIGPNRMIIHNLIKEYVVDGTPGILDPLGTIGNRLEVKSIIVDAFKSTISNLTKCVEAAGGEIGGGIIFGPLAASRSVLSKSQKDLGVVMIDIGAGTTSIAIYEENVLLRAVVLPVGSGNVTNDLAIGLRSSVKTAEMIKLTFGFASARDVSGKERLDLSEMDKTLGSMVSRRFISEIIEVRLEEILELIQNELKAVGRAGRLPAGVVITGGGGKISGIVDLTKQKLKLPVQLGIPEISGAEIASHQVETQVEDPEFAVACGLLVWGGDESVQDKNWISASKDKWGRRIVRYFLP